MRDFAALERSALAAVRSLEVRIAWPTLFLTVAILSGYWAVIIASTTGAVPLWVATVANSALAYLAYTPLHEASHGNIARQGRGWINRVVGIAASALLLHNFTMHRTTHLAHHANLNDPAMDADHWVAGRRWWSILLRCATLVFSHYAMGVRLNRRGVIVTAMAENLLPLAAVVVVGILAGWKVALAAMVVPALIGATLLGLLFDYAVHAPYRETGRFASTRMFLFPRGLGWLGSALWMGQNYHLIHHLYPWLPFYRYARGYRASRSLLVARNARIITL